MRCLQLDRIVIITPNLHRRTRQNLIVLCKIKYCTISQDSRIMHTAWKARCKVKEAFPAIYNSLNNEIELLVATEIVHRTVWGGGGSKQLFFMGSINCTNNVREIRNILKCLYTMPCFCLCDGKFYVIIPEVGKDLQNILHCFQNSRPFNVENRPNTYVRVAVSQTVQTKRENFFWSNAVTQSCIFTSYGRPQDVQQNIKGASVHSQLLSEIIPGNPSVIVMNLKPRLVWSWKFPKVWVVSTCPRLCLLQYSIVKRAT